MVEERQLGRWLGRLRGTATFVFIAALCLAVAVFVIGFIPGSPVSLDLAIESLKGSLNMSGLVPGVVLDPAGQVALTIEDPTLGQRMLFVATSVPGLLLVAEIARRMAKLLRAAQDHDPFTAQTSRDLTSVAKITAFGGLGVWAVSAVATAALSTTVLESGVAVRPHQSPLGWLAVGLIFAAFAQLVAHGVAMREELDTII